jgi:anti-sigma factor RsiW
MEHAEARELLEIAAVEPGGFARLVAGDTPEAAALAGHLAGCPACAAEMERLRVSAVVIRDAVRLLPRPELREQTLAYVAALGRPRGPAPNEEPLESPAPAPSTASSASPAEPLDLGRARRGLVGGVPRPGLWVAALAAAVVIAVAGTAIFVGAARDRKGADLAEEISSLRDVALWTIRVDGQPDSRHVALAAAAGGGPTGTLIFSPSSTDVVVVATGLTPPAAGQEYRCWVETGGKRQRVGRMFPAADAFYWVGRASSLTGLAPGSTFGISLVPLTGDPVDGAPVLVGQS